MWYVCKQDWYWYSLINYCISNNAYIGCDPPDVGLPLRQQSPTDNNTEVPADSSSLENVNTDPCGDYSEPVRGNNDAVQSCIATTSFTENGFVENLGDVTIDEESLLQLDGPIDKYPHKPQPITTAQGGDRSTAISNSPHDGIVEGRLDGRKPQSDTTAQGGKQSTVMASGNSPHDGIAEGTVCCGIENEADTKDRNDNSDEPNLIYKAVITENCVLESVDEFSASPLSTAHISPSVLSCLQQSLSDEFDVAVAEAVVADNCGFESENEVVPAILANPPSPTNVRQSVLQESVTDGDGYLPVKTDNTAKQTWSVNDCDVLVADTVVAHNCENFESASDVPVLLTSLPPQANANDVPVLPTSLSPQANASLSVLHESVDNYCDVAAVGAVNCASDTDLAAGLVPLSSPASANVHRYIADHVPESVQEHGIVDQLNRETVTGIDESAVGLHQDGLLSDNAVPPSCDNANVHQYRAAHIPESVPAHGIVEQLNRETVTGIDDSAVGLRHDGLLSDNAIPPSCDNASVCRYIAAHVPESIPARGIIDQLNRETVVDINERAVGLPEDKLLSDDAAPACRDNTDSEPAVTRPFIHSANDAGVGISEAGAAASVAGPLDPEIMGIINSVERSLAARPTPGDRHRDMTVNKSVAPIGVELQRKIVRQMEVGLYYHNSGS